MIQKEESQVEIVTGNSQRMKEIVMSVCEEYGFRASERYLNSGAIVVILV
jgi:uncharacterized protein (DUF1697 family)